MDRADGQADLLQDFLRKGAIVFKAIAVTAAADDVIAFATEPILQLAARLCSILKENDSMAAGGSNPIEFHPPVRGLRHQAGKCGAAQRFGNEDLDLVALGEQAQI